MGKVENELCLSLLKSNFQKYCKKLVFLEWVEYLIVCLTWSRFNFSTHRCYWFIQTIDISPNLSGTFENKEIVDTEERKLKILDFIDFIFSSL